VFYALYSYLFLVLILKIIKSIKTMILECKEAVITYRLSFDK